MYIQNGRTTLLLIKKLYVYTDYIDERIWQHAGLEFVVVNEVFRCVSSYLEWLKCGASSGSSTFRRTVLYIAKILSYPFVICGSIDVIVKASFPVAVLTHY